MDAKISLPICQPKHRRLPSSFQKVEIEPLAKKDKTVPHVFYLAMMTQEIPCLTQGVKEAEAINRNFKELMRSESKRAVVAARISQLKSSKECRCKLRCLETFETA